MTIPNFQPRRLALLDALEGDSSSVDRARDSEAVVQPLEEPGHVLVGFADGDHVHDLLLRRDGDEWMGDCWAVRDGDGEPIRRCKGLTLSDGPCAHLLAAWSDEGDDWVAPDTAEERADHHVEELLADGGRRRRADR